MSSYQVIARKWRPQSFGDVIGQRHITRTLENAIRTQRVAHAYIFSGVRGVGKTTTARILAKALNCMKGPEQAPCNECASCLEITSGNSLDVLEIDAASNRGIDQIRELREMVRYAAAGGHYKVVILDEAHQLTDEASNALLKTLEEPPDKVVFILATTASEKLSDTIRSRAQHFQFRALSFGEIGAALQNIAKSENLKIDTGALAVLARAAEGSLRDSLSLLEQAIAYCGDEITDNAVRELLGVVAEDVLDDLVDAIRTQSSEKALQLVHRLIAEGQNLQHFCREAIRHFRNLLMARVCGADSDLVSAPPDERERLEKQAQEFSEEDLTRFFQILLWTDDDLRHKPDPRLHLELGLLKMVTAQRLVPLEEVIAELRGEAGSRPALPPTPARGIKSASASTGSSGGPASPPSFAAPAGSAAPLSAPAAGAGPATRPLSLQGSSPPYPFGSWSPAPAAAGAVATRITATAVATAPENSPAPTETSPNFIAERQKPAPAPAPSAVVPTSSFAPIPSSPPRIVGRAAEESSGQGLPAAQLDAIRAALQGQRFLLSMVEQASRWEIDDSEVRLFFPMENRALAEMLQARDPLEKLRTVLTQVIGQPLRVCVKMETLRPAVGGGIADIKARLEEDPIVRAMLKRFGGQISGIKRRGEE
jgi:DNA polymerase-3 subunit gamma/tau